VVFVNFTNGGNEGLDGEIDLIKRGGKSEKQFERNRRD
jgi:hypothetical protein